VLEFPCGWVGVVPNQERALNLSILPVSGPGEVSRGDTIEKSQAPDDGCINVRNMLSIEEVK